MLPIVYSLYTLEIPVFGYGLPSPRRPLVATPNDVGVLKRLMGNLSLFLHETQQRESANGTRF